MTRRTVDSDPAVTRSAASAATDGARMDDEAAVRATRQDIERLMAEIDLTDAHSILFFGSKAQQDLTAISDEMLEGVRNKEMGPAGNALGEMLTTLRGDVSRWIPTRSAVCLTACSVPVGRSPKSSTVTKR